MILEFFLAQSLSSLGLHMLCVEHYDGTVLLTILNNLVFINKHLMFFFTPSECYCRELCNFEMFLLMTAFHYLVWINGDLTFFVASWWFCNCCVFCCAMLNTNEFCVNCKPSLHRKTNNFYQHSAAIATAVSCGILKSSCWLHLTT